ncbi:RAD50-interacting protein 1, partial [Grifola frondosa]
IRLLLQHTTPEDSEQRVLGYLNSTFKSLQDLEDYPDLENTVQQARQQKDDLHAKCLAQSQTEVDTLIASSRSSAEAQLHTAQELSLLRHSLADELSYLSQELVSSLSGTDGKPTLLEDLETLHRNLKELESVKGYVQVIEHALKLSASNTQMSSSEAAVEQIQSSSAVTVTEYEALQRFVISARTACAEVQDVVGQQKLHILDFLEEIRARTWRNMKGVLSTSLLSAAEKLHWPIPVDYVSAAVEDRRAFESAFSNLLKLQTIGAKLHASEGHDVEKEGLYPIQALVQPISLRFKYHFEGTRQTNRLDKPEWYFTHIVNEAHQHRAFMEAVIQPMLASTEYREVIAWHEFTFLLLPLLSRKLRRTIPSLLSHPPILAHTIYQALAFDSTLRDEGFDMSGIYASKMTSAGEDDKWEGISEKEWFEAWVEGERKCGCSFRVQAQFDWLTYPYPPVAMDQYMDVISAPDAWHIANDGEDDDATVIDRDLRPTNSARRVKALVEQVTDRYSPLPKFIHRTRFLIAVQLPLLESYHSRISSSLDAFETLSSTFMRAVPGALGAGDGSGRAGDSRRLTSGVEGVQRLCKALVSAKYLAATMEAGARIWCVLFSFDIFFLELWAEINHKASLRSRAESVASLPRPKDQEHEDEPLEGTIFEELVTQYAALAARAEDMIVQCVCGEVEVGLKAHLSGGSTFVFSCYHVPFVFPDFRYLQSSHTNVATAAADDIALSPALLGPIALLSSHLSFLWATLPRATATALYRRIASAIALHILQRQIMYSGQGRINLQEGRGILAECELWLETCRIALGHGERARAEGPWRQLLEAGRLVGAEGAAWQRLLSETFGLKGTRSGRRQWQRLWDSRS